MPGSSVEEFESQFSTQLNRDTIPLTLIALVDQVMVGTASLVAHDMPIRPNLSPWLAAVYVAPEHRQRGIGSRLVQNIEEAAKQLHIPRLYLFTPDRERFYARLGWSIVERPEFWNQPVAIMSKLL
jgi:N-acetylglutamate synthase-like GNAT family acetyltransferase